MPVQTKEARIILAIEAIRTSKKLSRRASAKIYNVPEITLRHKIDGMTPRADQRSPLQKLTELEEDVIIEYALDLDSRGFPPRIEDVREMADHILATRTKRRVGKLWPYCFVQRRKELRTRFAGLITFNPEVVTFKLDVKLRKPTPPKSSSAAAAPWVTQTPHNPTEAISQATLVNNSIGNHQESSPTPIFASTKQMAKGIMEMAHEMTLMSAALRNLRAANDALSKRRRAKKIRLGQGGTLTQAEGSQVLADKEAVAEEKHGIGRNGGGENEGPATARKCSKCGKTAHNARTCQVEA